jgi:flagellar protein FliS
MFAPYSTFGSRQAMSNAYTRVGVESSVAGGASPHRLVLMLMDGVLEAILQARGAIAARDVEAKGRAIGRASRILEEGLKAALDLKSGGELANNLHALYTYVIGRLMHANLHNDEATLLECQRLLQPVRDAWTEIGAQSLAG